MNKCNNQQIICNSVHMHAILCRITCRIPVDFIIMCLPIKCIVNKILIKLEACLPHQCG